MKTKTITSKKHGPGVFRHDETGLMIAVPGNDGHYLIEGTTQMPEGTSLVVQTDSYVRCWYTGEDVDFYVENAGDVLSLFELVKASRGSDPIIAVDPELFDKFVAST